MRNCHLTYRIPLIESKVMEPGGVSVTWKNLTVKVDIRTQHLFRKTTRTVKELIHNVNGYVQPKNLVAVMGASGSGKSTLMSVLANRQPGDFKVNGDIRLNGQKIPPAVMKTVSGFVYQNDLFTPILTVSEHLHLAARLKLDRKITSKKRAVLVDEILMDVGLSQCANRFIGNSNDEDVQLNLSGGERKRLSVATELLINPALLFCDEPTTGLDSYTALKLMTTMKNITKQKSKTIICSIHQPSEKIFELFDQIILIYDGKIAFSGAIEEALEFFQSIGYFYDSQQNPADYLVKSLSVVPGQEAKSKNKATEICSKFQISQYAKYAYEQIEYESEKEKLEGLEKIDHIFWLHKLILITYREVLCVIRGPGTQITNILKRVAIAVFLGFCLKRHTVLNQETVQSLTGILFIIENLTCYPPLLLAANHFPRKMPMFMREYSNNMNTPLIFYLSNIVPMVNSTIFIGSNFIYGYTICVIGSKQQLVRFPYLHISQYFSVQYINGVWNSGIIDNKQLRHCKRHHNNHPNIFLSMFWNNDEYKNNSCDIFMDTVRVLADLRI
ncbi:protein scarlet-like isoform X2 [Planococcus citri]|uniref:protein scarlet-like isoform X2 n=1 Tax=Planococcus citri TaxID=170843 RepID=UPI0031F943FA